MCSRVKILTKGNPYGKGLSSHTIPITFTTVTV